jgi:hypothetical protein
MEGWLIMALLKAVKTNYGIDATYWNIASVNENFNDKTLEVVMFGYISQEVRASDLAPVSWQNITLINNDYIQDATRTLVYPVLKAKYFSDAQDC